MPRNRTFASIGLSGAVAMTLLYVDAAPPARAGTAPVGLRALGFTAEPARNASRGIVVTSLAAHGAAACMGLAIGDVVVAIDGRPASVRDGRAGAAAELRIVRHGRTRRLTAC